MSIHERVDVSQYYGSTLYQDKFYSSEAGNVLHLPIAGLSNQYLDNSDRHWRRPESHTPLQRLLSEIDSIDTVEHLDTEKVFEVVDEKPLAIDLTDELRKVEKLREEGRDPRSYWDFFQSQAEYYANESYAKLGAVEYRHDLVNDHGRVKMWIKPMGKGAYESYKEAADKVSSSPSLEWYKQRSQIEADEIFKWEELLVKHQGSQVFVDISPAPFDVPEEYLKGTMFGKHSFIRLHQLVYDNHGKPHVFSRAHRTHLPPEELEVMNTKLTGEKTPWQSLLGNMNVLKADLPLVNIMGRKMDIRAMDVAVAVERMISGLEEQSGISEPVSSTKHTKEEMKSHYRLIEPALKAVFDEMVHGPRDGESQDAFMKKLVQGFQTWEKMLAARLNGEWDQVASEMRQSRSTENVDDSSQLREMYFFYEQQEYRPQANGCGTGSGASGTNVLSGSTFQFSGVMNSASMSGIMSEKKSYMEDENLCRCAAAKGPHFHCPGKSQNGEACKHAIVVGKGITKCPSCGKGKTC